MDGVQHRSYKSVARLDGCWAHIASVMWYLGFERHQQQQTTTKQAKKKKKKKKAYDT